jgi:BA14K-like protein
MGSRTSCLAGAGVRRNIMNSFAAALLIGPGLLATEAPALAASPAYCALYAREYATARVGTPLPPDAGTALQRLGDQAYYRCLNMDQEPEFPATSAYFGATEEEILGQTASNTDVGGPLDDIGEGDAAVGDETAVNPDGSPASPPAVPSPPKTRVANAVPASSGLKPWTPQWTAWCKAHYKSFNATTGLVLTFSGEKRLCP